MSSKLFKSSKAIIKVVGEEKILEKIINDEFFKCYIPSVSVINSSEIIDATIMLKENKTNKIILKYPNIIYYFNKLYIKDIISLIEYVFERARQEKGIICIHGASAVINNKAIICIGTTTGMVKTTLALELSKNNNLFYSDEKILIDLNEVKTVGRIKKQYVSNDYWRKIYDNKEFYLNENITDNLEYDLGLFIEPIICDSSEYILEKWDEKKFLWHIYEEASRKIRGTSRIFFNNTYPVMSLDSNRLAEKRLKLLKKLVKNVNAIYYKGNTKEIVNKVLNNIV